MPELSFIHCAPLRDAIIAADDDYLTALCNKGTFQRAKKDLAALGGSMTAEEQGETIVVQCGDAQCTICAPLGESRCSCPSNVMCRHRITAILWLKEQIDDAPPQSPAALATPDAASDGDADADGGQTPSDAQFPSLLAYPAAALCRQLGAKKTAAVYFRVRTEGVPAFSETSVITMELTWVPATVHLLEPLEHSTCSCHRTGLCDHKAEALLYYQLAHRVIAPEFLAAAEEDRTVFDGKQAAGISLAVRQALAGQLTTGLSRSSPTLCDTLERMAALCHVARLPALEKQLRAIGGEYAAYFGRSATFTEAALLHRLSACYLLALRMEQAETPRQRLALAGSFRTAYRPVGTLQLYALARRAFFGRSGFSGTTYYFWECAQHRFYTYTIARPTYYDDAARRTDRPAVQQAPWGLTGSLETICGKTLTLTQARATDAGRLSASAESRAALHDKTPPGSILPPQAVYRDFHRLLQEKTDAAAPETQQIACVQADHCAVPEYDTVHQVFSLVLYDEQGCDLFVEVHYRKEEKQTVRALEGLAGQLKQRPKEVPVFFGRVYLENARLKLYPIDYFTDWTLQ